MRRKAKKTKALLIRITEGQHSKLKEIAKAKKVSCSSIVRRMINRSGGQLKIE